MEQRHIRLLLSSIVALVTIQMQANAQHLPALVVCISVEELRTDYLRHFEPMMGEDGFRRMLTSGAFYPNVAFPMNPIDAPSALATIHTGVYPSHHGLEAGLRYDRQKHHTYSRLGDESVQGVYTREQYSPRGILAPTLADRLKEASQGASLVYSVGLDAEAAIVSGGAMPDGCFWLDNKIASWATSSYYPQMPAYIDRYNRSEEGPNKRLVSGKFHWKSLRSYADTKIRYSSWSKGIDRRYQGHEAQQFKQSPLANEEITNLALKLIQDGGYKQRSAPGLLSLSYSLKPDNLGELTVYDADKYLRLDADLSRLFEGIDKAIGLKNCLITLTGTGYTTNPRANHRYSKDQKELSLNQAIALLNMYLSATYGSGRWVQKVYAGKVYLNRTLAEQKKLSLSELQERSANFWSEIKGVARAYSAHQLLLGADTEQNLPLKRATYHPSEADIYWSLLPGWSIKEIAEYPELERSVSTAIQSPFMLMGCGVEPKSFDYSITTAVDIVRAVCSVLRIRPPNE